jgi:DNA-directed RNA polymerase specialized sigma24 family protein
VSAESLGDLADGHDSSGDVAALMPMVRRIVLSRVGAHPAADDLIQETLVRVLAAQARIEPGMLEPYAIVTARNVIATMWRDDDRVKRNLHKVVDLRRRIAVLDAASQWAVGRGWSTCPGRAAVAVSEPSDAAAQGLDTSTDHRLGRALCSRLQRATVPDIL